MDSEDQPDFIIGNVLELYNYFPKCSKPLLHADNIADNTSPLSDWRDSSHNVITSKSFNLNNKLVSSLTEMEYYSENSSDTL